MASRDALSCIFTHHVFYLSGKFDWHEKAWLVLWEARLIIQLPIGVLFLYPSALFIHFNLNISGDYLFFVSYRAH